MQNPISYIQSNLRDFYPDTEIQSISRLVIQSVTGISMAVFLSDKNKKITPIQQEKVIEIVKRLKVYEPLQYILGITEFFGLPFFVDENVLIPRPETEELVEQIVSGAKLKTIPLNILDIGTGSGAIAVALKKYLPGTSVWAWDISSNALMVAKRNATYNNVDITFEHQDVFDDYRGSQKFDIIVSNPPYVMESEKLEMNENVILYEPHLALFVPDSDPLLFYKRIAGLATRLLNTGGKLYFEINRSMGSEIVKLLNKKGFSDIYLMKDLSGNQRMISAVWL